MSGMRKTLKIFATNNSRLARVIGEQGLPLYSICLGTFTIPLNSASARPLLINASGIYSFILFRVNRFHHSSFISARNWNATTSRKLKGSLCW
jgi:hypothetical protein